MCTHALAWYKLLDKYICIYLLQAIMKLYQDSIYTI